MINKIYILSKFAVKCHSLQIESARLREKLCTIPLSEEDRKTAYEIYVLELTLKDLCDKLADYTPAL